MDVFDFWAWLRYFKLCQHLKLDMKHMRCKRSLVFTGSVVFPGDLDSIEMNYEANRDSS